MRLLKLTSLLAVAGGLAVATSGCSKSAETSTEEATVTSDRGNLEPVNEGCAAKPSAAASCKAKPCAAKPCATKPCAAKR